MSKKERSVELTIVVRVVRHDVSPPLQPYPLSSKASTSALSTWINAHSVHFTLERNEAAKTDE